MIKNAKLESLFVSILMLGNNENKNGGRNIYTHTHIYIYIYIYIYININSFYNFSIESKQKNYF